LKKPDLRAKEGTVNAFRPQVCALEERIIMSADVSTASPALQAAAAVGSAGADLSGELTAILQSVLKKDGVPALAGGVIVSGQEAATAAVGLRERGAHVRVKAGDQFDLGSNGKAITSMLAGILVDQGLLQWNTTILDVFPDLRGKINPAYDGVTLEMLLDHRSGLAELPSAALNAKILAFHGRAQEARRVFLGPVLREPPAVPVGQFNYSNTGYVVAATMMEQVTHSSYQQLVSKNVFQPLGMTSAGFGPSGLGRKGLIEPVGHDAAGHAVGTTKSANLPPALYPAGGMHMSMADWGKFLMVWLGEKASGANLVSSSTLATLLTADPRPAGSPGETYGFGWVHIATPLGLALVHDGSNGNWYSLAVVVPSQKIAAFAATNQGGNSGEAAVSHVVTALDQMLLGIVGSG
jgi:CubicO group peptidase (beta-lactamase class C family)